MEGQQNSKGGKDLYTEEQILEPRSKEKRNLLIIFLIVVVAVSVTVFAPIEWWIKTIMDLVSIAVVHGFFKAIKNGINLSKDLSAEDTIFRALGELDLEIGNVTYSRKFDSTNCLEDLSNNIIGLGFGFEEHASTSFTNRGEKSIKPRLKIEGTYKGLDFRVIQYKKYAFVGDDKTKNYFHADDRWSNAMNFLEIKLPKQFGGYVEISDRSIPKLKKAGAIDIETDDIIFNKNYKVISDDQLGAFILLNPRHIVKIQDFAKKLEEMKWSKILVLLFAQGRFYTQNESSTWVNINAPAKKNSNINRAIKKCQGISEFVKTYIDGLDLDKDEYTTRKGA